MALRRMELSYGVTACVTLLAVFSSQSAFGAETETRPASGKSLRAVLVAGTYLPASGTTRSLFGNSWAGFGARLGFGGSPNVPGTLDFDLDSLSEKSGGNRAFILVMGPVYTHKFYRTERLTPYVGTGAHLCIVDVRAESRGIDTGLRIGAYSGSLLAGVAVGSNVNIEAQYFLMSRIKSLDFSGLDLSIKWRL